ncbi:MAG TPA: GNAT family protein [Kofleriaceae bacterium]|jgi:RimJ/RimL family protein N-acetyltransferase
MISPAQLAARATLPRKPAPITLTGERVVLAPLDLPADLPRLFAISNGEAVTVAGRRVEAYDPDERVWRYMSAGPFASAAALGDWLAIQLAAPDGAPLTVRDRATGDLLGVANFLANMPAHLKVELGSIWYSPAAQGTGASAEATQLMLAHAFALGYRRVEWKCDALNAPSRAAALAYGFAFEGIQDAHYIIKDRNRDTAWFRMLDREWPVREPKLREYVHARAARTI